MIEEQERNTSFSHSQFGSSTLQGTLVKESYEASTSQVPFPVATLGSWRRETVLPCLSVTSSPADTPPPPAPRRQLPSCSSQ
jgi:hypothetical protein